MRAVVCADDRSMMTLDLAAAMHWGSPAADPPHHPHRHPAHLPPHQHPHHHHHHYPAALSPVFALPPPPHHPLAMRPKLYPQQQQQRYAAAASPGELEREFSPSSKQKAGPVLAAHPGGMPYVRQPPQSPAKSSIWVAEETSPKYRGYSPDDNLRVRPLTKRKYRKRVKDTTASGNGSSNSSQTLLKPTITSPDLSNKDSGSGGGGGGDAEARESPDSTTGGGGGGGGKRVYQCGDCQYVTDRKNNLKRHVATMHERCTKLLECCDTVFANKALLREHVRSCHSHGYDCRVCGRTFCRKALLKRHITVHSGQKDFVCALCGYATSHKSNLDRHKRRHLPKHLRKPAYFHSEAASVAAAAAAAAAGYGQFPGAGSVYGDGVGEKGLGANPLSYSLHGAYYGQSRGFRYTNGRFPHQVKLGKRPGFQSSRERRLMKKKFSTSYRKILLMKYGTKDHQSKLQTTEPKPLCENLPATDSDTPQQQTTDKGSVTEPAGPAPEPAGPAPEPEPEQEVGRLRGSRCRLAPGLHRCRDCDLVFPGQLDLSRHLEASHRLEPALAPQRPLTLQGRPPAPAPPPAWTLLVT